MANIPSSVRLSMFIGASTHYRLRCDKYAGELNNQDALVLLEQASRWLIVHGLATIDNLKEHLLYDFTSNYSFLPRNNWHVAQCYLFLFSRFVRCARGPAPADRGSRCGGCRKTEVILKKTSQLANRVN